MANNSFFPHIVAILAVISALLALGVYRFVSSNPPSLVINNDNWFGKGDKRQRDSSINNFNISVPNEVLHDLKNRLQNTRYVEPLEGVQWDYGTNQLYMKDLVKYWINNYDWKAQEKILNSIKSYKTSIDGIEVHFWHQENKVNTEHKQILIPIMLIHGWPGSFYEFYKVIPALIKASVGQFAFEIICPSIPGYGFSESSHKPGLNPVTTATIFIKLMARLGHTQYYVQGGDWGAAISRAMALMDKSHVKGIHLNMFPVSAPYGPLSYLAGYFTFPSHEHRKVFPLKDLFYLGLRETGYFHIQASRPDTIGLGLNNSPAGLASYIVEKFMVWTGCSVNESAACLEAHFTKDELITNIMIYWVTNSITSSVRFYKEWVMSDDAWNAARLPIDVPTGLAEFPNELFVSPKPWLSSTFTNIIHYSVLPKGGHFAAFEQPDLFVKDLLAFVHKVEAN